MSDYTTATGHDTTIVEIADGNGVRYWCESLGCTEAQLRESVQAVGSSPVGDFSIARHCVSSRRWFMGRVNSW